MSQRGNWYPTKRFRRVVIVRASRWSPLWKSTVKSYAHDVLVLDTRRPGFLDFFTGHVADCVIIDGASINDDAIVLKIIEAINTGCKASTYYLTRNSNDTLGFRLSNQCHGFSFSHGNQSDQEEIGVFLHPFLGTASAGS